MERETEALVSPPVVREEADRWCGERIEPGAEAARRDDLARDAAREWGNDKHAALAQEVRDNWPEMAAGLDRLADACNANDAKP